MWEKSWGRRQLLDLEKEGLLGWGKGERWRGCNTGEGTQLPDPALSSMKGALGSSAGDAQWGSVSTSIRGSIFLWAPYTIDTGATELVLPVDGC